MTKPTTLPRWSTDGSNMTAPSSTQQDTGWTPGQDGVSSYDNWAKRWTYEWLKWLNDGDVDFGDLVVTGSTVYNGNVDYSLTANVNNWDPAGTASLSGIHTIRVTADADWIITGLIAGVTGSELEILNVGTEYFYVKQDEVGSSLAANKINFPSQYVATSTEIIVQPQGSLRLRYDNGAWVVISMTGCMYIQALVRPGFAGRPRPTLSYDIEPSGQYLEILGVGDVFYDVTLPPRSIIVTWSLGITKNSSPSATLTAQLYSLATTGGAPTPLGLSDSNSASNPGAITLTNSPLTVVSDATSSYFVRVDASGTYGVSTDKIHSLTVFAFVSI